MCVKTMLMLWILCFVWSYCPTFCTENINDQDQVQRFRQKLDHFNGSNESEWDQRYLVNAAYYKKDGPVFLFLGSQDDIVKQIVEGWDENIKYFKAMCFYIEHRFYGDSLPTIDTSVESLQFLTSEQALADTAEFIKGISQKYSISNKSKWVTIGCGLGGRLSAQMRMLYPDLVHVAVSSCSAMYLKIDFPEFYKHIENSLASYDRICSSEINRALRQISKLFGTPDGPKTIEKEFKLCSSIDVTNQNEKSYFFNKLAVHIGLVAQNFIPGLSVKHICDIMSERKFPTPVDDFVAVFTLLRQHFQYTDCMPYTSYEKLLLSLSNTSWSNKDTRMRLQFYQSCTQHGIFQTSTDTDIGQLGANFPIEYFMEMCTKLFGNRKNDLIKNIAKNNNLNFQGTQSQTVYISGTNDAFFNLSFKHNLNYTTEAMVITVEGMTHCQDLFAPKKTDTSELKQARKKIKEFIKIQLKRPNKVENKGQEEPQCSTSLSKKKSSNCFTCCPDS